MQINITTIYKPHFQINTTENVCFQKELTEIDTYLALANQANGQDLRSQRINAYEGAFQILSGVANQQGNLPKELRSKLYEVLLGYGSNVHYNQGLHGFRDCARIMRLSLLLQCKDLNLLDVDYQWQQASSLQRLVSGIPDLQNEELYSLEQLNSSSYGDSISTALEQNPEMRKTFSETFVKLAYSLQNMPTLKDQVKNRTFQHAINEMTMQAIGVGEAQKELYVDFLYNRRGYLVGLDYTDYNSPECIQAQYNSYEAVKQHCLDSLGADSTKRLVTLGQIENMRGILTKKMNGYSSEQALEHFRSAVNILSNIPVSENLESNRHHNTLLNNARGGLVIELLKQPAANMAEILKYTRGW